MLQELEDYGWELASCDAFEYSSKYECFWVHFIHMAFPDMHICIEIEFNGLNSVNELSVSDDNADRAGDSYDVLVQSATTFNIDNVWKACEEVMEKRRKWGQ